MNTRKALINAAMAAGILTMTAAANAQVTYGESFDGPRKDLGTLLRQHNIGSNVVTDQVSERTFRSMSNNPVSFRTLFGVAGYFDDHKLGWYQPTGTNSKINYVSGSNPSADINGIFGVALKSPDGTFRSETALNADKFNHVSVLRERDLHGNIIKGHLILAWEDLKGGGDKDYQDRVIRLKNVEAVPEPGTMAALSLGALAFIRKRKTRKG